MARGALSRIADIVRADVHDLLNRMEEPDKMEGLPELKIIDFTEFVAANLKEG